MERRKQIKLDSPIAVRKAMARIANMLINDEIEPKVANAIILCGNSILGAIRTDEQQRKIDELERLMSERAL